MNRCRACGRLFAGGCCEQHPSHAPSPAICGDYTLEAELGRGAYGAVYRARDDRLDRPAAVKVLFRSDALAVERFEREGRALAQLRHPHLVEVYAAGEVDGQPWLAMALARGEILTRRIAAGPLEIDEATSLLAGVARALEYLHDEGWVHRDVKPDNIIVDAAGFSRLVDLGIARPTGVEADLTDDLPPMTPSYAAPELADAVTRPNPAADVYALGVVLYECLTGHNPFRAPNPVQTLIHQRERVPEQASALRPGVPDALDALLDRMMAKDPDARPTTVEVVAALTQPTATGEPTWERDAPTPPPMEPSRAARGLGGRWAWLLALPVIGLAAWGLEIDGPPPPPDATLRPDSHAPDSHAPDSRPPADAARARLFIPGRPAPVDAVREPGGLRVTAPVSSPAARIRDADRWRSFEFPAQTLFEQCGTQPVSHERSLVECWERPFTGRALLATVEMIVDGATIEVEVGRPE